MEGQINGESPELSPPHGSLPFGLRLMKVVFRHGLRAPEICSLRWEQEELAQEWNAMRASAYRERGLWKA